MILKNVIGIVIFIFVLIFIFGCTTKTKLADYQPNSAEEKEVLNFMKECNDAYQNRNFTKWLACFDDNATIKSYRYDWQAPTISKRVYEGNIAGYAVDMENNFYNPKINKMGDKATFKCRETKERGDTIKHTLILVKDGEQWSIVKWDYSWQQ